MASNANGVQTFSETITIRVTELRSGVNEAGQEFWDIDVTHAGQLISSSRLYSPWSPKREEELDWYLEVFASGSGSPFEKNRAGQCHLALLQYGEDLLACLSLADYQHIDECKAIIDVEGASFRSTIFKLHWETLELSTLRHQFNSVHVRRCFRPVGRLQPMIVSCSVLNILLVIARPTDEDIDYLLVAQRIVAAAARSADGLPAVNIEVVRPGTWEAVLAHLDMREKDHGRGYFQVIHLDVHGLLIEEGVRQGVYLTFLDKSGTTARFKKADIVAKRLQKHGVFGIVLNACRSASNRGQHYSNLCALFLEAKIPMVIGMTANVSIGAVEIFSTAFYKSFLHERKPWHIAITNARHVLATERERNARFGLLVELDDWIVPTLYASHDVMFASEVEHINMSNQKLSTRIVSRNFLHNATRSTYDLIDRVQTFKQHPTDERLLIGRDALILHLENTLLLPFQKPGYGEVWRKHIHIYGWAGAGKTALMKYLCWWWKKTRLVEDSIYIDCLDIEPWSTRKLLDAVYKLIYGNIPSRTADIDALVQRFLNNRYMLIIDHLELLSKPDSTATHEMKVQLTQFLGAMSQGQSFLFTVSRNATDSWLIVPRALIYPVRVTGLSSPNAVKLAKHSMLNSSSSDVAWSTTPELACLNQLLEQQDYLPAGIQAVTSFLRANKVSPGKAVDFFRTGKSEAMKIEVQSRFEEDLHVMIARLFAEALAGDASILQFLDTLFSLSPFRRRIPPSLEAYLVYRALQIGDRSRLLEGLSEEQIIDLFGDSNTMNVVKTWAPDIVVQAHQQVTQATTFLETKDIVWQENLQTPGGYSTIYWHLHPLFSFALQIHVNNGDIHNVTNGHDLMASRNRAAFAHFYERRLRCFEDTEPSEATFSVQRILFELDNISVATDCWLESWMARILPSFILLRVTQTFNLNMLGKQDYRLVMNLLAQYMTYYENLKAEVGDKELHEATLTNFLMAAGQLQNSYFSTCEWQQVRNHNVRIQQMLTQNPRTVGNSPYARAHEAQADMVAAFELKSRNLLHEAKALFQRNLDQDDVDTDSLSNTIAYAKLRMMNSLGLLQCEMQRLDIQVREMELLCGQLYEATEHYQQLNMSAPFAQGWAEDNKLLLQSVEAIQNVLKWVREVMESGGNENVDITGRLPLMLQQSIAGHEEKQGVWATMFKTLSDKKSWTTPELYGYAILDGFELAHRENADNTTLANYLSELTSVSIHRNEFSSALESHRQWQDQNLQQNGTPDIHTQLYDAYVLSLCFYGLHQPDESRCHVRRALLIAEETAADKIKLACLLIDANLDVDAGNAHQALRSICTAGMLAYNGARNAQYDRPGSILKFGAYIFAVGSGLLQHTLATPDKTTREQIPSELQANTCTRLLYPKEFSQRHATELYKSAIEVLGFKRSLNSLMAVINGHQELFFDNGEFRWDNAECKLFGDVEDPGLGIETLPLLTLPGASLQQQGPTAIPADSGEEQDAPHSQNSSFVSAASSSSEIAKTTIRHNDSDRMAGAEALLPLLLRLSSSIRDSRQRTVFWHLCGSGNLDFNATPDVFASNLQRLMDLDLQSRLECIREIVKGGADIEAFDDRGTTPLMHAIGTKAFDIAAFLMDQGADINAGDFADDTALHHAVARDDIQAVHFCITWGSFIDLKNALGQTALAVAVQKADLDICRTLVRHGANVLAKDNVGVTCVLLAALERRYEIVALCLATLHPFGFDLTRRILLDYGYTRQNFIDMLIENVEDFDDEMSEIFDSILRLPEDLVVADRAGVTPYHRAVYNSTPTLVRNLFIKKGADSNVRDNTGFGMTPLLSSTICSPAHDMAFLILNEGHGDISLRTLHSGLSTATLLMMGGLTMTKSIGQTVRKYQFPLQKGYISRHMMAWARSCKVQYYQNLSPNDLEQLIDFKRQIAFELDKEAWAGQSSNPVKTAILEMSYETANAIANDVRFTSSTGRRLSRIAANVHRLRWSLTRDIGRDDSNEFIDLRFDLPWKGNLRVLPHIYHIDRHGRCRHVEPVADRDDEVYRIWVVDEQGIGRGVLGAVD